MSSMKRVVVRVYQGDAKAKGNPIAQAVGFLGASLSVPGSTVADWTAGVTTATAPGATVPGATPGTGTPLAPITPGTPVPTPTVPNPNTPPAQ
jgi:hypothetical protein